MFVIPLIFVLIALDPPTVCFIIAVLYALSGIVMAIWRRRQPVAAERARRHESPTDTEG